MEMKSTVVCAVYERSGSSVGVIRRLKAVLHLGRLARHRARDALKDATLVGLQGARGATARVSDAHGAERARSRAMPARTRSMAVSPV